MFRALDDETRRVILDELAARDGRTLFEICSLLTTRHGLGSTRQAISQHLGVLESAGLVVTDSIPLREDQTLPQTRVLSVAQLLGEAIKRIHRNESVSRLFR